MKTTVLPRPVRVGAAVAGVAGILTFAGCATTPAEVDELEPAPTTDTSEETAEAAAPESASGYADGTYTADGSYATPESVETVQVTVTLADGVVTDVEVVGDPQKPESERYQGEFIGGISDVVVGVPIDELAVSRVAGSSLTSGGFNQAIELIKVDAAA